MIEPVHKKKLEPFWYNIRPTLLALWYWGVPLTHSMSTLSSVPQVLSIPNRCNPVSILINFESIRPAFSRAGNQADKNGVSIHSQRPEIRPAGIIVIDGLSKDIITISDLDVISGIEGKMIKMNQNKCSTRSAHLKIFRNLPGIFSRIRVVCIQINEFCFPNKAFRYRHSATKSKMKR